MSWCHEGRIIIVYYTSGCDVEKKEIGVGEVRFLMLSSLTRSARTGPNLRTETYGVQISGAIPVLIWANFFISLPYLPFNCF